DGHTDEVQALAALLARLDLRPVDRATAELATALCRSYRLRAADATHLATAMTGSSPTTDATSRPPSPRSRRPTPTTCPTRANNSHRDRPPMRPSCLASARKQRRRPTSGVLAATVCGAGVADGVRMAGPRVALLVPRFNSAGAAIAVRWRT